jgi:hypothetical protein
MVKPAVALFCAKGFRISANGETNITETDRSICFFEGRWNRNQTQRKLLEGMLTHAPKTILNRTIPRREVYLGVDVCGSPKELWRLTKFCRARIQNIADF